MISFIQIFSLYLIEKAVSSHIYLWANATSEARNVATNESSRHEIRLIPVVKNQFRSNRYERRSDAARRSDAGRRSSQTQAVAVAGSGSGRQWQMDRYMRYRLQVQAQAQSDCRTSDLAISLSHSQSLTRRPYVARRQSAGIPITRHTSHCRPIKRRESVDQWTLLLD